MTAFSTIGGIAQIPFGCDDLGVQAIKQPCQDRSVDNISLHINLAQQTGFDYCELLCKEAKIYTCKNKKSLNVKQIWINASALEEILSTELTQLVYKLPNYFNVSSDVKINYGIDINYRHITQENLALLKGLNFRQLRIHFGNCQELSKGNWISQVANHVECLTSYGFSDVFCAVHLDKFHSFDEIRQLILSLQLYSPLQIELLGNLTEARNPTISQKSRKFYLNLINSITSKNYRAVSNQLFIAQENNTSKPDQPGRLQFTPTGYSSSDIDFHLGLGLNASGYMENIKYKNIDNIDSYRARLNNGQLPHQQSQPLVAIDPAIYRLTQHLMCHNELDPHNLTDLQNPLRRLVESAIAEACDNFWLESAGYLWRLTPSGMVAIRSLYHQLIQGDPSQQKNILSTG